MSPLQVWMEFQAWVDASPPAFLFLMLLPFLVAIVVFSGDALRTRAKIRRGVEAAEESTHAAATSALAEPRADRHAMAKVLIPVDGSENALRAVRHVVNQSLSRGGLEAHLLHVRTPFSRYVARFSSKKQRDAHHRESAEEALARAREMLRRYSVPHAVHMDVGERAEAINRMAKRLRVNKIVMGTARKSSLTRLVQDSVTSRVMETAQVPVEVISGGSISKFERYGVPAGVGTAIAAVLVAAD